jgi:DNA-binding NarL/FixJ family response regulator
LDRLADLVRGSGQLQLEEATGSLTRLAETLQQAGRVVGVARLHSLETELPALSSRGEGMPLVVLLPDEARVALQALRLGARAVLGVDPGADSLAAAVMSVSQGLLALPAGVVALIEPHATWTAPPEPLTPRELEILGLLAGGDSNKTIAARLSISVHTVKFHISSILAKLGVTSRTEAVALGLRLGIVLL